MMVWPGPGGQRDEYPAGKGGCDGDCGTCSQESCEERGAECRDDVNCRGCTARGWCPEAINDNEEDEE